MSLTSKIIGCLTGVFGLKQQTISGALGGGYTLQFSDGTTLTFSCTNSVVTISQSGTSQNKVRLLAGGVSGSGLEVENAVGLSLGSADRIRWATNGAPGTATDTSLLRVAAGVVDVSDAAGTGAGYIRNKAGDACLANNYTNATATLSATNLSYNVISGRSYLIEGELIASNSTASEGMQITFDGGGATATTFDACISAVAATAPVNGTLVSAALATALTYTTVTGLTRVIIRGFLKAGSTGTFILRAAEVTHTSGTLTIQAGSWLSLRDANPL